MSVLRPFYAGASICNIPRAFIYETPDTHGRRVGGRAAGGHDQGDERGKLNTRWAEKGRPPRNPDPRASQKFRTADRKFRASRARSEGRLGERLP